MIRTNVSDAITTTLIALLALAALDNAQSTGLEWAIRAVCIYPFTHLAWRAYRHRQHQ